jgi:phage terminase large subunit-like protein
MAVASAKFEAGEALLLERASWLPDLEAELFSFPGSRHDDQCESISQALLDRGKFKAAGQARGLGIFGKD